MKLMTNKALRKRMEADGRIYLTDEEAEMKRRRNDLYGFIVSVLVSVPAAIWAARLALQRFGL